MLKNNIITIRQCLKTVQAEEEEEGVELGESQPPLKTVQAKTRMGVSLDVHPNQTEQMRSQAR